MKRNKRIRDKIVINIMRNLIKISLSNADFIKNQTSHEIWEIKEAIVKKTKMEALFRCQFYNETANYVSEIIMCVNHHASGFQNCDSARDSPSRRTECMKGKKVIFP